MPETLELTAKPRTVIGKQVNALRRSGWIPATLYGKHRAAAATLQIEERALRLMLSRAGNTRLVRVTLDGGETRLAILREIQREPISHRYVHVDLQEVSMTEKMTTDIPIVLVGTSPAVTRGEALLLHGIEEISVRMLASDLISEVKVDVSILNSLDDAIHVRDLKLGDQIEILTPVEEMLAKLVAVKEEKIEEAVPAPTTGEVEVIGKGKKEEEGAEEAAAPAAEKK